MCLAFSGCKNLQFNEYDSALYLGNQNNPYVALIKVKNEDANSCTINERTIVIADSAFEKCENLVKVNIPISMKHIREYMFYGCDNLTIYCEAEEQPNNWENGWNSGRPVVWGYKGN